MANNTPIWRPDENQIKATNIHQFVQLGHQKGVLPKDISVTNYAALHQWSISCTNDFWLHLWQFSDIISDHSPTVAFDETRAEHNKPIFNRCWFPNSNLNFAENLLNKGHPEDIALMGIDERQRRRTLTYRQLKSEVIKVAQYLLDEEVGVGDRVAGYLANTVESVIAMLATTYIGAIWSSCSPDFGTSAALDRFSQIEPKVLFYSDGYYYKGKAISLEERIDDISRALDSLMLLIKIPFLSTMNPPSIPVPQQYSDTNQKALDPIRLPFDQPLYILFSSGTTGKPKCIVHSAGGTLLQHLKELILHSDVKPHSHLFFFTTCGWMMWNWLISGLATGATIFLYDGSPFEPEKEHLLKLLEQEKITHFGASAKYFSELEKANIHANRSANGTQRRLEKLAVVLSTGSPLLAKQFEFIYQTFKSDLCVASISGGTDIVSCFALGNPTLPVWPGELQCAGLGMNVDILATNGTPLLSEKGELVCYPPFPAMPLGFWNDPQHERYIASYFAQFSDTTHNNTATIWAHGDFAEAVPHPNDHHIGYIIHGRSDATLNPGGVRIGTAEIYRQVDTIEEVIESIAIGQDYQNDVRIILFVHLKESIALNKDLIVKLKTRIREGASPRHVPAKIIQAPDLPRTFSGKLSELTVKNLVSDRPIQNRGAIANPECFDFFTTLTLD